MNNANELDLFYTIFITTNAAFEFTATFAITKIDGIGEQNDEDAVITANLHRRTIERVYNRELSAAEKAALERFFNDDFIINDSLSMSAEYLNGASGELPIHAEHGRAVFCSDLSIDV